LAHQGRSAAGTGKDAEEESDEEGPFPVRNRGSTAAPSSRSTRRWAWRSYYTRVGAGEDTTRGGGEGRVRDSSGGDLAEPAQD